MCGRRATCKKIYIIFVPSVHSRSIHHLYWKIFEYFIYGYSMWKSYNRCFFMREYFMAAYYKWPLIYVRSLRGSRSCLIIFFIRSVFQFVAINLNILLFAFEGGRSELITRILMGLACSCTNFFLLFHLELLKKTSDMLLQ